MKRALALLLMAASSAATVVAWGEGPADYAFRWPLARATAPLQRVAIPREVYEAVAYPDLRDLRVFNAAGEQVPYAFADKPAEQPRPPSRHRLALFPLRVDDAHPAMDNLSLRVRRTGAGTTIDVATTDGRIVKGTRIAGYVADASDIDEPVATLVVTAQGEADLDIRVRVEASDDLARWRTVAPAAALVRLSQAGRALLRDRIEFAPTKARYYRVTSAEAAALPGITAIDAEGMPLQRETVFAWADVAGAADESGAGRFAYDARAALPVSRIGVELAAPNTVAPAEVQSRAAPKDEWRTVTRTTFYRLGDGAREIRSPAIDVASSGSRYWRLVLDPRAGIGAAPILKLGWPPAEVIFAARGDPPFVLAFGRRDATAGALPLATLVPNRDEKAMRDLVAVTTLEGTPQAGNRAAMTSPVELRRMGLWAGLGAAVAVLLALGWRMLRQVSATKDPATPEAPPRS